MFVILLPPEPLIRSKRDAIADFALTHGLPQPVVDDGDQLPAGGLMVCGQREAPMRSSPLVTLTTY